MWRLNGSARSPPTRRERLAKVEPLSAHPAIRTEGLSKDYGSGRGLFDLDLEIERGEVFGFLGPNGAGKSTTMRLLLDLIQPTAGSASLLGLDTRGDEPRDPRAGSASCPATSPSTRI